jgi:hypothetical protein
MTVSERSQQDLGLWADRLDAFIQGLDAIDADDPVSFREDAWQIWATVVAADPPPNTSLAMLLVNDVISALARNFHRAPGTGDRAMLAGVHASLKEMLTGIHDESQGWRRQSQPTAEQVKAHAATMVTGLRAVEKKSA